MYFWLSYLCTYMCPTGSYISWADVHLLLGLGVWVPNWIMNQLGTCVDALLIDYCVELFLLSIPV